MKARTLIGAAVALGTVCWAGVAEDVKLQLERNDFAGAARSVQSYRQKQGVTPDVLEALSWLARAELARGNLNQAEKYAQETYQLSSAEARMHPLPRDPNAPLALALGAAIEVEGNVIARRGERAGAVTYLRAELLKYSATSIAERIQKNVNLLSLEGKPAPALQGVVLPAGKTVLLFFWAHWCPDCKAEAAVLKQVKAEFGPKGLVLIAPTQHYGYAANGDDAPPAVETLYIEQVRRQYYAAVIDAPLVVNERNFRVWGASSTPTLALVDRKGVVRMYHPGAISYQELRARILETLR